jgi:hypothetical protein
MVAFSPRYHGTFFVAVVVEQPLKDRPPAPRGAGSDPGDISGDGQRHDGVRPLDPTPRSRTGAGRSGRQLRLLREPVGRLPRQSHHHRRHSRRGRPDGGALQADREHRGTFMGVPPTGRALILNGQTVVRVRDSRVVERSTTSDLLGLLIQLGAIPAPGGGVRHRSRVPVGTCGRPEASGEKRAGTRTQPGPSGWARS